MCPMMANMNTLIQQERKMNTFKELADCPLVFAKVRLQLLHMRLQT